jgi:hypothetical protein
VNYADERRARFADVKMPIMAFAGRDLEFDVAELALRLIMARAYRRPLVLLPAVLFALPASILVYNAQRGQVTPRDLAGRRVGCGHSVTTVT